MSKRKHHYKTKRILSLVQSAQDRAIARYTIYYELGYKHLARRWYIALLRTRTFLDSKTYPPSTITEDLQSWDESHILTSN